MASRPVMRVQWKLHKLVWRASGGQLGTRVLGMPVLELITTGRKTGQPRPILISYLNVNGAPTLIGTHAGAEHDPAWVGNLRANPDATVVRRGRRQTVRARFLDGDEHDRAWQAAIATSTQFEDYRAAMSRPVPIVALDTG
ncbi:nitroreductase/quinone reductase family protein [Mycolicibacterium tusciae]|jgi:deazaflavin-dependent oxidoreductase (nitroreductase family)|uniref:nitroreductase/quinone reductase family protein n=1 Tax=Mycolicibacterium tusciae TaxID=75922 RepID=UPI00024A473E|nr:nitroreductase/quinone reductase family protein [Mycolicibacterium tusciae]